MTDFYQSKCGDGLAFLLFRGNRENKSVISQEVPPIGRLSYGSFFITTNLNRKLY